MASARTFVPTLEDIGLLSDIKMDTIADTSNELVIYTARFKDLSHSISHTLETLHKRNRVLKNKRNQCIEKLFDERCKIFSEELQAHYRSVGESLVGRPGLTQDEDSDIVAVALANSCSSNNNNNTNNTNNNNGGGHGQSGLRLPNRQHVESGLESGEGSTSRHTNGQEEEEPPSYFQHEQSCAGPSAHTTTTTSHRRTFSLESPACSSSSSSLSLHSPVPPVRVHTTDSPPDYNARDACGTSHAVGQLPAIGPPITTAAVEDDEDAQFRSYHQRYDTRQHPTLDPRTMATMMAPNAATMDMPPGYEETRYHTAVDPI